ncbi:hypothetical protein OH492_28120 [Vibrio chagasii]|nr:hypothetical protein [Vibrio chagasii]
MTLFPFKPGTSSLVLHDRSKEVQPADILYLPGNEKWMTHLVDS